MIKLVDDAIVLGVREIRFSGFTGETLIQPCYEGVLMSAKKAMDAGLRVGLVSNGIELNQKAREVFVNAHYINISLDVPTREIYKRLKGRNAFDIVLNNIKEMTKLKRERETNVIVRVSFIIRSSTINKMESIVNLLKEMGVDEIIFKMAWEDDEDGLLIQEKLEEIYGVLNDIREKYSDNGFKVVIMDSINEAKKIIERSGTKPLYNKCYFPCMQLAISPDGLLKPCCHYAYNNLPDLGDLNVDSLTTIIQSRRMRQVLNGINPERDCRLCFRAADQFNRFLLFLSKKAEESPDFIVWFEKNYILFSITGFKSRPEKVDLSLEGLVLSSN